MRLLRQLLSNYYYGKSESVGPRRYPPKSKNKKRKKATKDTLKTKLAGIVLRRLLLRLSGSSVQALL